MTYAEQHCAIQFSILGMNKWLHRQGFTYKKLAGILHKFDEERQKQFIESYEDLKKTAGSRTWLNILGALNLNDIGSTIIHDYKTINDYNIARFFIEIHKHYPDYRQRIHVILDGAGYH